MTITALLAWIAVGCFYLSGSEFESVAALITLVAVLRLVVLGFGGGESK